MANIGIKPQSKVVDKGIIRIQKLIDELTRELNAFKARVTTLETSTANIETNLTALAARVTELES